MIGTMTIRGVPRGLLQDAWWLSEEAAEDSNVPPPAANPVDHSKTPLTKTAVALAFLLALGDLFFYRQEVGISLALYAYAIFAASVAILPSRDDTLRPAILMGLSGLPVIEYLQPLSILLLVGGVVTSVAWVRVGPNGLARTALNLLGSWPLKGLIDFGDLILGHHKLRIKAGQMKKLVLNWAFPVGGALILLSLLMQANPVLEGWFDFSPQSSLDFEEVLLRTMFWGGLGLTIWPFLSYTPPASFIGPHRPRARVSFGLNTTSVANALILFNLLLALQTFLDLAVLWGGTLPEGMSHATYARRGAYPLLVTALLAGGFALAARPHLGNRQSLSTLMMIWLGQNLLLTASAAYRLSVYVDVYGLTYLRAYAAIWMGLVAIGLVLIGWYIHARKPNAWLASRGGGLALGPLYICAFINFAQVIAGYNLSHPSQFRGVDSYYACSLGPMAAVALARDPETQGCAHAPQIEGWRDWGFRRWRVARLLTVEEATHEEDTRGR